MRGSSAVLPSLFPVNSSSLEVTLECDKDKSSPGCLGSLNNVFIPFFLMVTILVEYLLRVRQNADALHVIL